MDDHLLFNIGFCLVFVVFYLIMLCDLQLPVKLSRRMVNLEHGGSTP